METVTLPYQEFLDRDWYYLLTVRALGDWEILSTSESGEVAGNAEDGVYLLLVVNRRQGTVIECRYDSWQERYQDVEMVRRLPPGGEAGAGAPAWLRPVVPSRAGSAARPLPDPPPPEPGASADTPAA